MLRLAKVATPSAAATLAVPSSVPLGEPGPIATVTVPVKLVATSPPASRAVTRTAGLIEAPAVPPLG